MQTPTTPTDTDSATTREIAYATGRLAEGAGRAVEFYSNSVNVWTADGTLVIFIWSDEESLRNHEPFALVRPDRSEVGQRVDVATAAKVVYSDLA